MFGELNGTTIANQNFDLFKQSLNEAISANTLSQASIDDIQSYTTDAARDRAMGDLYAKTQKSLSGASSPIYAFGKPTEYVPEKMSWTFKNYNTAELYQELSDGSMVQRFDTYTPGINNYEDHAQKQTTGDKAFNGFTKFWDTFGTGVVGGTVGAVYGVKEAIKEGSFSALYDNDFMRELDLHSERMNVDYANYVTAEQARSGFMGKGVANFIADDVSQGLAFTAQAIATEAIWSWATGGASLATVGARIPLSLGRVASKVGTVADKFVDGAKYLDDALKVAKVGKQETVALSTAATRNSLLKMNKVIIGGKTGEGINLFRGLVTSAGYEAGFEARAFMSESRRNFKEQYKSEYGKEPSSEELADFEDKLKSTANGLYTYNLALVGASNIAQFGSLMGMKLPKLGLSETLNKKIFGVGTEIVEGAPKALKATTRQKALQFGWSQLKSPLTEGAFEEGLQSVGSRTASNLMEQSFNKDLAKENYSTVETFAQSMLDTYTKEEGLQEIFTGMIVGALTGNAMGMYRTKGLNLNHEFTNPQKRAEDIEKAFGANSDYSAKVSIENMLMTNRILASKKAEENAARKGDLLGGQLSRGTQLYAQFQRGHALDYLDEQVESLSNNIDLLREEDLAKNQGITLEQAGELKASMKEELNAQLKTFKKVTEFSNFVIGNKLGSEEFKELFKKYKEKNPDTNEKMLKRQATDMLKQAMSYELFMGETAYKHSDEMFSAFQNEVQNILGSQNIQSSFSISDVINKSTKAVQKELFDAKIELSDTKKELANLEKTYRDLENVASKATTPEARQEALNKLNDLALKRTELTEKEADLTNNWNVLFDTAKLQNPFGQNKKEYVSSDEIVNNDKVIAQTLGSINQLSPEKGARLKKLLKEYEKSVVAFKKYSERTDQMTQGNLGYQGILGGMLLKSNPNKATIEMIKGIMDTHFIQSTEGKNLMEETISDISFRNSAPKKGVSIVPTPEDKAQMSLVEYIKQSIKENPYLFEQIGEDYQNALPTDEELIEYIELYSPVLEDPNFDTAEFTYDPGTQLELFKKYLSEEEIQRLQELNTKFANWQLMEGASLEGATIAELIQQQANLTREVKEDVNNGILTEDDLDTVVDSVNDEVKGKRNFDVLQTPQNVFVQTDKEDVIISHLTPQGLLELKGQQTAEVTKKGAKSSKTVDVEDINAEVEAGDIITYGNTTVKYIKGGRLVMKKSAFMEGDVRTRATKSGYSIVFDQEGKAMKSDFSDVDSYSPQESYKLQSGDELTMIVDLDDAYNKSLVGKSEEEFESNLKISFYDNRGNKVADLKASYQAEGETIDPNFLNVRKQAVEAVKNSQEGRVTVGYAPVSTILLGSPNLELTPDGKEKLFDIKPNLVKDYGYWDGQKMHLKEGVRHVRIDFLKGLNKEMPIVIVEEGNTLIAYPVTMNKIVRPLGTEIMEKGLSKAQLALELTKEAKDRGIKADLFYISDNNTNMFQPDGATSEELENVVSQLNAVQEVADYKGWINKGYKKEAIANEATININMDGIQFLSPKIVVNLSAFSENKTLAKPTSVEVQNLFALRSKVASMGTLNSDIPAITGDGTFKMQGANYNYFIDPETGDILINRVSIGTLAKLVKKYNEEPAQEGKEEYLKLIRDPKASSNKGQDFFSKYNESLAQLAEMENRIQLDPDLKAEYDNIIQLDAEKQAQANKNKKC